MLSLKNISKTFNKGSSNEINVLNELDLDIKKGEFAILLGDNGSGKSTLLKIISGEIKTDKNKCMIKIGNTDVKQMPEFIRSEYVSYVRQKRDENLVTSLTVSEVFMLTMTMKKSWFKTLLQKKWHYEVESLLSPLKRNLEDRIYEQIRTLSGGEHQILTILIAAEKIKQSNTHSNLLLLDEHVAHLDPDSSKSVMKLTSELVSEYELTTLMVTHNVEIASKFGDRLLILKKGKIEHDFQNTERNQMTSEKLLKLLSS